VIIITVIVIVIITVIILIISYTKRLSNIPGKHEIKVLHTAAILGTAHKLREVLM